MSKIKRIDNPGQFLLDTGLLFEINRRILHPLGMALEVVLDDETGAVNIGGIWDYRHDIEGIRFDDGECFDGGLAKWERFMEEYGNNAISQRQEVLGYVVQGEG